MTPEQYAYDEAAAAERKAKQAYDKAVNALLIAIRCSIPSTRSIQTARRAVARAEANLAYWRASRIDAEMRL